jgi:hypothetical protein
VVTRGTSIPLVVDATSNCADAAGVAVPMPTLFWANANPALVTKFNTRRYLLQTAHCLVIMDNNKLNDRKKTFLSST